MRRLRRVPGVLAIVSTLAVVLASPTPSVSAATALDRTWVASTGADANPCTRELPCQTWAGAIGKTANGGEIDVLDDGSYGAVVITKAITLDGNGHLAGVTAPGTSAITVDPPFDAQVVLRGIDLVGTNPAEGVCPGVAGVRVLGGASVRLDDVSIAGFERGVVATLDHSSLDVFVDMSLNDVHIANNCLYGIDISPVVSHAGRLALDGSTVTGSNIALHVGPGGEAWVSNSRLYLNNGGVDPDGGPIHSYCNNQVAGNATDGAFTDDLCPAAPTTTYCVVPNLRKRSVAQAAAALHAVGCSVGKVSKKKSSKKNRGKVFAQAVARGIPVKLGTAVAVTIGK